MHAQEWDCWIMWQLLFVVFERPSILFSIVAAPIYISTDSLGGFPLPTPSPAFTVCGLLNDGRSDWCEAAPHCSFELHVSDNEPCWASFHVPVGHLYVFLEAMSVWVFWLPLTFEYPYVAGAYLLCWIALQSCSSYFCICSFSPYPSLYVSIVDHILLSALCLLKIYIFQTFPGLLVQDSIMEDPSIGSTCCTRR